MFYIDLSTMENNISKRFNTFCLISTLFLLVFSRTVHAQDSTIIRPPVTKKLQKYYKQIKDDSTKRMVELKSIIPGLVYDLRYASTENFMQRLMYQVNTNQTFLRLPASLALLKVQQELNSTGLGLKIFDAYRPYSVTEKFWELVRDERYVANPARGSGHNRGIAIDLTIVTLKTGKELDMGTGFDNFTDTAHHSFTGLSAEILKNRKLLRSLMEKHGFKALETEWWHYFLQDAGKFELLDIPFSQLGKSIK